ncbi:MAG: hypothetical protein KA297_29380 [Kofleriaceae bacterium]|nr:hypothetical protein [Kofleriaceae bacterium]MBP6837505.1 hypothetical protein [Kofleriaceae bacterium]
MSNPSATRDRGAMMGIGIALVLGGGSAACDKASPSERARRKAAQVDFWPEAPKPAVTAGTRTLAYQPANLHGYRIDIDVASLPGADMDIRSKMRLDLTMRPGPTPDARLTYLTGIDMQVSAPGQAMSMRLDHDRVEVDNDGSKVTIERGETGPFTVEGLVDTPTGTMTIGADGTVTIAGNPGNQFVAGGANMVESAFILFPDLPAGAVAPGHTWSMTRAMAIGGALGTVDVTYEFRYAGDGACPSGATTCSLLTFTAASPAKPVHAQGLDGTVGYGFAGKVFLDHARGAIDEARVRLDMDVKLDRFKLPMGGTYAVKALPPS